MCEQLWLEFASTEVGLKLKDAFEDAKVLNNVVQEIMSSCEACWTRRPLECFGYGPGQQRCHDDRLDGLSAPRTHRGTVRCGAHVEGLMDKFHFVCLLVARSLSSLSRKLEFKGWSVDWSTKHSQGSQDDQVKLF